MTIDDDEFGESLAAVIGWFFGLGIGFLFGFLIGGGIAGVIGLSVFQSFCTGCVTGSVGAFLTAGYCIKRIGKFQEELKKKRP